MKEWKVTIPASAKNEYPLLVGSGALSYLSEMIEKLGPFDSLAILYDKGVEQVAELVRLMLGTKVAIEVESGEESKSLREVERISSLLLVGGINRQSLLINIGGGMVTDLGGFVASCYMRGIAHLSVPTTLLGMVDAAVGGKTGVNLGDVKNIIGDFHHPRCVIADIDLLETLSSEQMNEGLVEVVKIAAMMDATFFERLEERIDQILERESEILSEIILRAIQLKAEAVEEDERDTGKRLFLNFGHTVGHAIEALSHYSLSHGKAVSIGMVCEMRLAGTVGSERVIGLLKKLSMPTELSEEYAIEDLLDRMRSDKKGIASSIRYAAPKRIGEGEILLLDTKAFTEGFS